MSRNQIRAYTGKRGEKVFALGCLLMTTGVYSSAYTLFSSMTDMALLLFNPIRWKVTVPSSEYLPQMDNGTELY